MFYFEMIAFGLHLFILKILLKNGFGKQNIKEIRNKKKKRRKERGSPWGPNGPVFPPSPGPSLPSASAQTHRATPFPLSLSRSGGPAEQQQHPGPGDQAGRPKSWPGRAHLPLPPLSLLCG
jgi:hypothetical protein